MSNVTVPSRHWFTYQMWLNHNYMYPIADYKFTAANYGEITISFTKHSDLTRFVERWEHTFG